MIKRIRKNNIKSGAGLPSTTFSQKSGAGFTLIEIVIFIGIASGIILVIGGFVASIVSFKDHFGEALKIEQEIQLTLTEIIPEIRAMNSSNIGNYAIEAADEKSLTFYSDIDKDSLFERVRYFLDGTTFKKGVIEPTGNPLQYVLGNEIVRGVVNDVATSSIFSYFDSNYTGTGTPMAMPINISDVRLVNVTLSANRAGGKQQPITFSAQATMRNLRSN